MRGLRSNDNTISSSKYRDDIDSIREGNRTVLIVMIWKHATYHVCLCPRHYEGQPALAYTAMYYVDSVVSTVCGSWLLLLPLVLFSVLMFVTSVIV